LVRACDKDLNGACVRQHNVPPAMAGLNRG
jgi:hypothetical protein